MSGDASSRAGAQTLLLRPSLLSPPPRDLPRHVDIFGAGRAVRAMLTVAALQGSTCRFRVWCRHHSRAELLRIHLADLPPLPVEIVVGDAPPGEGAGPVVLALGLRTSRRSRQKSKDALFSENLAIIETLLPRLRGRVVIVVTNPSTRLTARLCADGVAALGIGVMNDQLRFERDAGPGLRLVGAHNPFELAFGRFPAGPEAAADDLSFPRGAYRDLTNRQDRQRPLLDPDGALARWTPRLHENAWRDLGGLHDRLDLAQRWYARQRLASRYLENGVACGRAILSVVDFLTGTPQTRPDLTIEAPIALSDGQAFVAGWPWDAVTGQPRALRFGPGAAEVMAALAGTYAVPQLAPSPPPALTLVAEGLASIRCSGVDVAAMAADIVPLAAPLAAAAAPDIAVADIDITMIDEAAALPGSTASGGPLQHVAQHRGKNAFEHRDLTIQSLEGARRLIGFGASGARALVDDASRQILLAVPPGPGRRDEFRKLVRDQILTPAYAAAGAWVLHAGLVRHAGAGLLLLGDSGAGKTTGALHLLAGGDTRAKAEDGYGASERVLVFLRDGQMMALGVPESLTIFPGSLRGLAGFADLVADRDAALDWVRASKLRLTRDAVVSRLGTVQIAEPIEVSHVALLRYRPGLGQGSVTLAPSPAFRREALKANDLTTEDDVRAAWLGWSTPCRDGGVPGAIEAPSLPFVVMDWSTPAMLAGLLAGFARDRAPGPGGPAGGGAAA